MGKWSDVVLGREEAEEFGRIESQGELMKILSSLLRIGGFCILLQVKFLSSKGIS
jgi:hypothetical protein